MSQYHLLIQPPSAESAQHQDACGIRNNPLYSAWAILAQIYTALAQTRNELEAMPPTWKVRIDLGELHRAMVGVADRRDMAWNYYADAERKRQPAPQSIQATYYVSIQNGTCRECGGTYAIVSDQPDTFYGLCDGCWTDRKASKASKQEPPNDTGEPHTTP